MIEKRIRLTRGRLGALNMALSIDDVLYEKFRRLDEQLRRREERLRKMQQVIRVLWKKDGGPLIEMQIVDVCVTENGTMVKVR